MVIAAIGQSPDVTFLSEKFGIEINARGIPVVNQENYMTARKGVFAGGDCITGPRNVIEVIADGRKAARSIHQFFTGSAGKEYTFYYKEQSPSKRMPDYEATPRQKQGVIAPEERWDLDAETETGLSKDHALNEAGRCLLCHFNIFIDEQCILCGGCVDICPYNCISMVSRENVKIAENFADGDASPHDWDAAMVINEEKCIRCGLCVKRCPVNAITMRRFAYSANE
jgi:formate dehydrogenase major subunit